MSEFRRRIMMGQKNNSGGLPNGYIECDYILMCGNYIDTGLKVKPTTSVFLSVYVPSVKVQTRLFAVYASLFYQSYINGNGQWAYQYENTSTWRGSGVDVTVGYHTSLLDGVNKRYLIDGGDTVDIDLSGLTATKTSSRNLLIGLSTSNAAYRSYLLVLGGWVKEDGMLVRNFVPAREILTGNYGLYDTVGKQFYSSATAYGLSGRENVTLPHGYTKALYVETENGKQVLTDTNISYDPSYAIKVDMNVVTQNHLVRYFSMLGTGHETSVYIRTNDFKTAFQYGDDSIWVDTGKNIGTDASSLLMDSVNKIFEINGGYTSSKDLSEYSIGESWENFSYHPIGYAFNDATRTPSSKIYYEELIQKGNVVARYIPCVNSNNVWGLYNVINNTFITSDNEYGLTGELYKNNI